MNEPRERSVEQPRARWRTRTGLTLLLVSIGWPVLVPVLPLLGVSARGIAAFSGVMIVAAELMLVVGAAVAGKEGFAFIKAKVFGWLRSYGPPREVSRTRYTIGLVMFTTPLAFGWAAPYFADHIPGYQAGRLIYAIVFDVLLLISLFVLGGGFWDKLRSLFRHDANAMIPDKPAAEGTLERR